MAWHDVGNRRMNDAVLLRAEQLGFSFPDGREIIRDLSFTLREHCFHVLIGPSGVGKSTLLKLCAGLLTEQTGAFSFDEQSYDASRRLSKSVYMPQNDTLLPWRTVAENVNLTLELQGFVGEESSARTSDLLHAFGLTAFANAFPQQLSGGMKQRATFARTMLKPVPLLLLDEPFSALDNLTRKEMQRWLLDVWHADKRTVLMVTHDIDEALLLADYIYVWPDIPCSKLEPIEIQFERPRRYELVYERAFIERKRMLETMLLGGGGGL